jgi:hypothetical protein
MKIAILLLAHKNKEQLEHLLKVLRHEQVDIFVHVDKKCSFLPSDIEHDENVHFVEKRYDVGLFEFSMVDAEIELIRTAKKHGNYHYFVLMSGQCYPLFKMDDIYAYLKSGYPEPYIEIVAPTSEHYVRRNFRHVYCLKRFKLRSYAFLKKHFSYKAFRCLRYIPGGFVFAVSRIKEWFCKSPKARLQRMGYPMYCGSQWWILPDTVIDNVLIEYDNKKFCKAVYDTFSCDETFFQTTIMKHAADNGIVLDDNGNFMNRRWFFIFDGGHPIILKKDHYQQIMSSGMLFARKFEMEADDVLDMIDRGVRDQNIFEVVGDTAKNKL